MQHLQREREKTGDGGNRTHGPFPPWIVRLRRRFSLLFGRIPPPADSGRSGQPIYITVRPMDVKDAAAKVIEAIRRWEDGT